MTVSTRLTIRSNRQQGPKWETAQIELWIRSGTLILNSGYDTAINYHGSAKMRQILKLPFTRSRGRRKNYMRVFIKYQITRHYFKARQSKSVRMIC